MTEKSQNDTSTPNATGGHMPQGAMNGSLQAGEPLAQAGEAPPPDSEWSEVLHRFWEGVKRLPAYIRLAATVGRDDEVSRQAKGVLVVGGAYAVSPVDLVPGVIPVIGQLDDLYVLLTALQQSLKMMPEDVADRHLANAGVSRDDIEGDMQTVRDLVRIGVKKSLVFGGKALGRISRAAYGFANDQRKRWSGSGAA